jgi:hypothetical protein
MNRFLDGHVYTLAGRAYHALHLHANTWQMVRITENGQPYRSESGVLDVYTGFLLDDGWLWIAERTPSILYVEGSAYRADTPRKLNGRVALDLEGDFVLIPDGLGGLPILTEKEEKQFREIMKAMG